ncbi:peptidoglycan/xylan/chitin deacetylase (PgdA/CDA1 family) [Anseongella ginsenosidimutans]|uniref:Peptidoglycan/xylan/chitin deacetylase (PgdA/CDA1 family) n=1 Tax=Anseongella ginsenosidimutans TaxID=496056 RepID=A0A4R3KWG1_9SPHI|nr:polysaccharide deacetylase family protein [Anseongella ginsenosidimutans]QEC51209.1 polysaccharide deacetylase family protein [Anseongella ginsenosidimutans]TCS90117.1 peptidoglycan/xylan/chitin deacetylase (PgdA/CDA1 family) [Anseongella ginsenosidimutans]
MKLGWIYKSRQPTAGRALVLMYHRVANVPVDPWQMAVRPEHFEEQLQVLGKRYSVIPVPELLRQLEEGKLLPGSVCLTFDDGYADNYLTARPLLEKYQCPATFFIVTRCIDRKHSFWWDTLGDLLLNTAELPEAVSVDLQGERCSYPLNGEVVLSGELHRKYLLWRYPAPPPGRRAAVYLDIYERVKSLPPEAQERAAREIRLWREDSSGSSEEERLPVNTEQLMSMSRHPLLDIGLHTHSHPALGCQSPERQFREIESCRKYLARATSRFIPVISYPHGHYNKDTLRTVKEQQLEAAFTTEEQAITRKSDPYRLGRFQVGDWNGETFEKQLSVWMGGKA